MTDHGDTGSLIGMVTDAYEGKTPLSLRAGNSKAFYGRDEQGVTSTVLDLSQHAGILSYEPTELVLTARGGTPVSEIHAALSEQGQMLPFDPPQFTPETTIGGAIAAGLSGPGRPWRGAARDLLLGVRLIDGGGQHLTFGGQVMKNVAGYDVSRLMAGAMGTLGILTEVSIKVLPKPVADRTLVLDRDREDSMQFMGDLAIRPAPLSGVFYLDGQLHIRLSGDPTTLDNWQSKIGGEVVDNQIWQGLRDHQLDFFQSDRPLWRLSLPPATPRLDCEDQCLVDWAGAQRWLYTDAGATDIRSQVAQYAGHATAFRHGDRRGEVFQPLEPVLQRLHIGLKQRFDPQGILNLKRLYSDW